MPSRSGDERDALPVASGLRTDIRELVVTSVSEAKPELRETSPEPSIWPLIAALATTGLFIGSIFTPWAVVYGTPPLGRRVDHLVLAEGSAGGRGMSATREAAASRVTSRILPSQTRTREAARPVGPAGMELRRKAARSGGARSASSRSRAAASSSPLGRSSISGSSTRSGRSARRRPIPGRGPARSASCWPACCRTGGWTARRSGRTCAGCASAWWS